ncbi:hypothetical protein CDD83_10241 [Cordyceps sp. RAO-2017]|nr:hypothetical protein CDD83_10241 [Cordyceps sp. RAO-2017]
MARRFPSHAAASSAATTTLKALPFRLLCFVALSLFFLFHGIVAEGGNACSFCISPAGRGARRYTLTTLDLYDYETEDSPVPVPQPVSNEGNCFARVAATLLGLRISDITDKNIHTVNQLRMQYRNQQDYRNLVLRLPHMSSNPDLTLLINSRSPHDNHIFYPALSLTDRVHVLMATPEVNLQITTLAAFDFFYGSEFDDTPFYADRHVYPLTSGVEDAMEAKCHSQHHTCTNQGIQSHS